MAQSRPQPIRIGIAVGIVLAVIGYLSVSAANANKSYYVTIQELYGMGTKAYTRHLRVAGNVVPGSIVHHGAGADFELKENTHVLKVDYDSTEPPPDTFKDNAQALAVGTYGRDGVFHATEVQAKCASKYAPKPVAKPTSAPVSTASLSPIH
jgi:cytochrome c-type biogenesis protein CcmE